jgi:hypothetical protein
MTFTDFDTLLHTIQHALNHFNYENALFYARILFTLYPKKPESLHHVALCYFYQNEYYSVISLLSSLELEYVPSLYLLAKAYDAARQYLECEQTLQSLLDFMTDGSCQGEPFIA